MNRLEKIAAASLKKFEQLLNKSTRGVNKYADKAADFLGKHLKGFAGACAVAGAGAGVLAVTPAALPAMLVAGAVGAAAVGFCLFATGMAAPFVAKFLAATVEKSAPWAVIGVTVAVGAFAQALSYPFRAVMKPFKRKPADKNTPPAPAADLSSLKDKETQGSFNDAAKEPSAPTLPSAKIEPPQAPKP